jgi:uncharacterized membrane protein YcaP (DUF421 family)
MRKIKLEVIIVIILYLFIVFVIIGIACASDSAERFVDDEDEVVIENDIVSESNDTIEIPCITP